MANRVQDVPHGDETVTIPAAQFKKYAATEHVAWCRYKCRPNGVTTIHLCDSDASGAFRVYAAPVDCPPDAAALICEQQDAMRYAIVGMGDAYEALRHRKVDEALLHLGRHITRLRAALRDSEKPNG